MQFKYNFLQFNDILDSFECCFCGMSFESPVALSVHQMAAPVVRSSCRKCRKYFYSDQDYDHHICSKVITINPPRPRSVFNKDEPFSPIFSFLVNL